MTREQEITMANQIARSIPSLARGHGKGTHGARCLACGEGKGDQHMADRQAIAMTYLPGNFRK